MPSPSYFNDLVALFSDVQTFVINTRAYLGLPPLVNSLNPGGLYFGQEYLRRENRPPRIVIVPTGATYARGRRMPQTGAYPSGQRSDLNPQVFLTRLQSFEAHIWGDPTSTPSNPPTISDLASDFNACIEMERELLDGLRQFCGNTPNLHINGSDFVQPTDDTRLGRLLILKFAIETQVQGIPATVLPYANPGVPGSSVTAEINVQMDFPDGSSTVAGTITVPNS